jgi:Family of unknown function (DUF6088)
MQSVINKIIKRIRGKGRGHVYTSIQFLDLGSRAAVDQAMSRLARRGLIRRLKPGIYDYPRINPRLGGTLSPPQDEVAQAVAKKNSIRIQATGAQAANALGLTTQVPAKKVFLTDGKPRTVKIGKQTIVFRHATPKTMIHSGKPSKVVIQALRYLGQSGVNKSVIMKLRNTLSDKDKTDLIKDIEYAPDWLRPVVNEIVQKK